MFLTRTCTVTMQVFWVSKKAGVSFKVFSQKALVFHRQEKRFELNLIFIFPQNGQSRQAKSFLQSIILHSP